MCGSSWIISQTPTTNCLFNILSQMSAKNFKFNQLLLLSCFSRVRLCDHRGSPPGSPVPGILQARTLEWVTISFSSAGKWKVKMKSLSRVRLLAAPWSAAYQAPPSMGFPFLLFSKCNVLLILRKISSKILKWRVKQVTLNSNMRPGKDSISNMLLWAVI